MSNQELTKLIIEKFGNKSTVKKDDIIEAVRPYHEFDAEKECERSLNRKVNNIMASIFKDENNVRKFFLIHVDGEKVYANIDMDQDAETLKAIRSQAEKMVRGYTKAIRKLNRKIKALETQISIEQWQSSKLLDNATNQ